VSVRVGSLFAGIGGFDLAAERAGMEVVWQSEIDNHASKVLAHHWPEVPNYGDIHDMGVRLAQRPGDRGNSANDGTEHRNGNRTGRSDLSNASKRISPLPAVDVLTGGFPCQDYSVAGLRDGLAGDRGALWWEYHRLITELRPTWVVGENVPGLLSSRGGADFETIVGSLTECGYGVAWAVLDAQYFGVAQRRRRVFIVGNSGGQPRPEVLALSEGLFGHPAPSRETGETTAPTLAARTRGGGWPGSDEALDGAVVSSLTASHSYDQVGNEDWLVADTLRSHPRPGSATVGAIAATLTQGAPSAGRRNEDDVNLVAFAQNQRDELRALDVASSVNAERWGTAKNETLLAQTVSPHGYNGSHADAEETRSSQVLRELRDSIGEEAYEQWAIGIIAALRTAQVLRPWLYGGSLQWADAWRRLMGDDSLPREEACTSWAMLTLRETRCVRRSPSGSRSHQQLARELGTYLSLLSHNGASRRPALLDLWRSSQGLGLLREALSTLQEMGRPDAGEGQPARSATSVRRLTPLEAERLQGFPDGWTDIPGNSDTQRYRQLGNAVAVPVVKWILRRLT